MVSTAIDSSRWQLSLVARSRLSSPPRPFSLEPTIGTERRLPVSDAVVLAEYRAGNSQRALALRYKVSKGAIQKAIAREEAREAELIPAPSAAPEAGRAQATRPLGRREIRARLEHEALNAGDSRTRLGALKMLHELDAEAEGGKQSEEAGNKRFLKESGYFFAQGSLVIERRKDRFQAYLRTREGWVPASFNLNTLEGRAALLVRLVEIFRGAPPQQDEEPEAGTAPR